VCVGSPPGSPGGTGTRVGLDLPSGGQSLEKGEENGRRMKPRRRGDAEKKRWDEKATPNTKLSPGGTLSGWNLASAGSRCSSSFPLLRALRVSAVFFFLEDPPLPGFSCTRKTPAILPSDSASPGNPWETQDQGGRALPAEGTRWRVGEENEKKKTAETRRARRRKIESAIRKPRSSPGADVLGVGRIGRRSRFFFSFSSPRLRVSAVSFFFFGDPRPQDPPTPGTPPRPAGRLRKPHSNPEGNLLGNPRKSHSAHKTRKRQKNQEKKTGKGERFVLFRSFPSCSEMPGSQDSPAPGSGKTLPAGEMAQGGDFQKNKKTNRGDAEFAEKKRRKNPSTTRKPGRHRTLMSPEWGPHRPEVQIHLFFFFSASPRLRGLFLP